MFYVISFFSCLFTVYTADLGAQFPKSSRDSIPCYRLALPLRLVLTYSFQSRTKAKYVQEKFKTRPRFIRFCTKQQPTTTNVNSNYKFCDNKHCLQQAKPSKRRWHSAYTSLIRQGYSSVDTQCLLRQKYTFGT